MNIELDKRKTNILYVDKKNNHLANNNEVIKFVTEDNDCTIDKYIAIISGFYKLTNTETTILKYIITNRNDTTFNNIYNNVCKELKKCEHTIYRAIMSIRNKGIIYYDGKNLQLSKGIDINVNDFNNAKFFVIELNPNKNNITISI